MIVPGLFRLVSSTKMLAFNKQQLSLLLLIVLLSATILLAVNNGKNDINKYLLQEHLNYWVNPAADRVNEWHKAKHYFDQANSSYVSDPDTLSYGSILFDWGVVLNSETSTQKSEYRTQGQEVLIESIQRRPLWAHTWKDSVVSLHKYGNYNQEFQESFRNTIKLGHQEDRIQVELSNIGLQQWSKLSVENRKLFIPFLRNSARKHAVELTRLKHSKMSQLILCNAVRNNSIITTYCLE